MSNWLRRTPNEAVLLAVQETGLAHKTWIDDPLVPLFLLVHGRAGNCGAMWPFSFSLPTNVNVLLPEAFLDDPDDGGRSWWLRGDASPEALENAQEQLLRFLEASQSHYGLQPAGIVGIGFSQGAALLSSVCQRAPNLFRGVGMLAGFVVKREPPVPHPRTDVFMAHGRHDQVISIDRARAGAKYLADRGYRVALHEDDVEHKVGKNGMRELKVWAKRMVDEMNSPHE